MRAERLGVREMRDVTRDHAFAFMDSLTATGRAGKTRNNIRGDVASVFSALMHRANLTENVWSVVRPAPTDDSVEGRALTDAEVSRLFAVLSGEWHGAVLLALYTGLRYSDVVGLQWSDVVGDRIELTPSKTKRHGTRVVIPLHRRVSEWLATRPRADGPVFPELHARDIGQPHQSDFTRFLTAAGIEPGEGKYLSFHSLRHTFRTRLAAAEVRQEVAMKLGGWKSGSIAERYNHDTTSLRTAIDRLP